jgi:hypothetical protein
VKNYLWEGYSRFSPDPKEVARRLKTRVEAAENGGQKDITLPIWEMKLVADLAVKLFRRAKEGKPSPPAAVVAEGKQALAELKAKAKREGRRYPTDVEIGEIINSIRAETDWSEKYTLEQLHRGKMRDRRKKKPTPEAENT